MNLQMTCSGGGPVIAIPAELAAFWRGTLAPIGVVVPEGWTWGSEPEIICDYDRACYDVEDSVENGDGGFGWLAVAGTEGIALSLDMELMTSFLPLKNGGVILRGYNEEHLTAATAQSWVDKIDPKNWKKFPKNMTLKDGRIFMFDSAYAGHANATDITADDGVCVAQLAPGEYSIKYTCTDDSGVYTDEANVEYICFERL